MKTAICIALTALTAACASGAPPAAGHAALAEGEGPRVTFRLVDVMISPTRIDGRPWDAVAALDEPGARDRVVTAMNHESNAKRAYDAASVTLGRLGNTWGGLPDVGGRASIDLGEGKVQTSSFDGEKDTLTPHFTAHWDHVPLTHWTMVRMFFVDHDATDSDIGAVVLSPHDLAAALEENGKVHHIRVDDQTNGQILFVGIVVTPEG